MKMTHRTAVHRCCPHSHSPCHKASTLACTNYYGIGIDSQCKLKKKKKKTICHVVMERPPTALDPVGDAAH